MTTQPATSSFRDSFVFRNSEDGPVTIMLEPWTPLFVVEIGEAFHFEGVSSIGGSFESTREDNLITLYGWEGSTVKVYRGES